MVLSLGSSHVFPKNQRKIQKERERESREYVWDLLRMFFDLRREKLPLESQPYI